jgi:hypothetical protein
MLVQLKKIQVELASKIESQTNEVVVIVSLEHQKLQSLLNDNLMMRRQQELLSFNVYSVSNYQKRSL